MTKWDYKSAHEAALKCSSKREFDRSYGGACAWARRHGVLEEITSHMQKHTLWDKKTAIDAAKPFKRRSAFVKALPGCAKWLKRNNLFEEACEHMAPRFFWDFDLVKQEASNFSSRHEFHEGNPSAAQWAIRNGYMEELFPHKLTFWDFDAVAEEALKYSHREEFRVGSAGAAQWAARNGVWDTVCSHMDLASRSDYDCVYIWKPEGFCDVYKIGVTSKRLGAKRIEYVSGNYGMSVELLYLKHTTDALPKEKEMLSLGKPAKVSRNWDGFSEFRHLSDSQFLECLRIMGVQREEAST